MCCQELAKGVTLGFLAEGDEDYDENTVQIKVYNDSIPNPSSPSPTSRSTSASSQLHLQLSLPTNALSHTDGTTSLTDSQIQQACTFIDDHLSIQESLNNTRLSVLILTPRMRPEEAMSIGISYLAGVEEDNTKMEGRYDKGASLFSERD